MDPSRTAAFQSSPAASARCAARTSFNVWKSVATWVGRVQAFARFALVALLVGAPLVAASCFARVWTAVYWGTRREINDSSIVARGTGLQWTVWWAQDALWSGPEFPRLEPGGAVAAVDVGWPLPAFSKQVIHPPDPPPPPGRLRMHASFTSGRDLIEIAGYCPTIWLPVDALCPGAGVMLLTLGSRSCFKVVQRKSRALRGHCPTCGYDVCATTGACPECGANPRS
jgi:hypothetical protein